MPLVSTFGNLSASAFGLGAYRAATAFSPSSLFSAGEQGVWYDPSDLTTMFEDAAGTTAVHTPGNGVADSPVGLLLDKHSGAVGTNGAAQYNLLTYSEQFDNAYWAKSAGTVTANSITAPDGTATADLFTSANSTAVHAVYNNTTLTITSGLSYTARIYLKAGTQRYVQFYFGQGQSQAQIGIVIDTTTMSIVTAGGGTSGTLASSSATNVGSGWYLFTITGSVTTTSGSFVVTTSDQTTYNTNPVSTGNGTFYIWGADLRLSSQAALTPTYQPITSSWVATMAGNHATQSTSTARPTLSARYNLVTYSEQFNNGIWGKDQATVTADTTTAPDGTTTADSLIENTATNRHITYYTFTYPNTSNYTFSLCAKANTRQFIALSINPPNGTYYAAVFDVSSGTVASTRTSGAMTGTSNSITSLGNGWYRCTVKADSGSGGSFLHIGLSDTGTPTTWSGASPSYTGNGTSGLYIWGADCRLTNDGVGLPVYQRIADANTYDSVGFPYFIKFDGVDDYLTAGNVCNILTADGLTGVAGALITGAGGSIYAKSLFAGVTGRYGLYRQSSVLYGFVSSDATSGIALASIADTSTASRVITSTLNPRISSSVLWINGSQIASGSNLGLSGSISTTYRLLIGAYNNSTDSGQQAGLYLNGRIYGLILRIAISTTTERNNTETWMNGKTKAY